MADPTPADLDAAAATVARSAAAWHTDQVALEQAKATAAGAATDLAECGRNLTATTADLDAALARATAAEAEVERLRALLGWQITPRASFYTGAEVAAWGQGSWWYTGLKASIGVIGRAYTLPAGGTTVPSSVTVQAAMRDDAVRMVGHAKVFAADPSAPDAEQRRAYVHGYVNVWRPVTTWVTTPNEQQRLEASWWLPLIVTAAALTGYVDDRFDRFLVDVCLRPGVRLGKHADGPPAKLLDWTGQSNWLGSFSAANVVLPSYLGDAGLFAAGVEYTDRRMAECIYDAAQDDGSIVPLRNPDNLDDVMAGNTANHWGKRIGPAPGYAAVFEGKALPDGVDAEAIWRDYPHTNMGHAGRVMAVRAMVAQGYRVDPGTYQRLQKGVNTHARRCLARTRGVSEWPVPVSNTDAASLGDISFDLSWAPGAALLGLDASTDLLAMRARQRTNRAAHRGYNLNASECVDIAG